MNPRAAGRFAGLQLPAWLIMLSSVPLLGGVARLLQLSSGDPPAPEDLRFAIAPLPVTLRARHQVLWSGAIAPSRIA